MIVFQFFGTAFASHQLNTRNEYHSQFGSTVHPHNMCEETSCCQQGAFLTQDSGLGLASMNYNVDTASGTEETFGLNMHSRRTLQHENNTYGKEKGKNKRTSERSVFNDESNTISCNPFSPANTSSDAHGYNSPLGICHEKNDPHGRPFNQLLDSWVDQVATIHNEAIEVPSTCTPDYHNPRSEPVLSSMNTIPSRDMSDESHNSNHATSDPPSDVLSCESSRSFGLFTAPLPVFSPSNPPSNRLCDDESDMPEYFNYLDCATPDPSSLSVFDLFSPSNPNCDEGTPFHQSDGTHDMNQHSYTVRKGTRSRRMTASQPHESSKRQTPPENQRTTPTPDQYRNTNYNSYPSASKLVPHGTNTGQISPPTIFTSPGATDMQYSHLTSHKSPVFTYTEHFAVPVVKSPTHVGEPLNHYHDVVQNSSMSGVYSASTTEQHNLDHQVHSGEQSMLDSSNFSSCNNFNQEYRPRVTRINSDDSHATYFDEQNYLDRITLQPLTPVVCSPNQLFGENSAYQEQMGASSYHRLSALVESSVESPIITSEIPMQDQNTQSAANSVSQCVTLEPQELNDEQALIFRFRDLMKQCELGFESEALKYFGDCYMDYINASESECSNDNEYDYDYLSD